jgi:hypothetical protein
MEIWKIEVKPFELVYNEHHGVGWICKKYMRSGSYFYDVEWFNQASKKWIGLSHGDIWGMKEKFKEYQCNTKLEI